MLVLKYLNIEEDHSISIKGAIGNNLKLLEPLNTYLSMHFGSDQDYFKHAKIKRNSDFAINICYTQTEDTFTIKSNVGLHRVQKGIFIF